ncbi:MAG: UPF0716 protein FxsA [Halioglobus sp.]|jgi:UPF0716 protein FxsA
MRLLFMLLPWMELFTLIQLGIKTTAFTALLYVLVTFVMGVAVIRQQGMGMMDRLRASREGGVLGPELLVDDMALGLAGLLLIFPGMISDVAALIVVIGPLRRRIASWFAPKTPEPYVAERDQSKNSTIEGEFRRLDD